MMRTSETLASFATALASAQAELTNVSKNKTNPHFKSDYADLSEGLDVVRPVFSKHGLSVLQSPTLNTETGAFVLVTRLLHKSGEWVESVYPLNASGKPQEIGSAITYARRYSVFALAGIAATDDDDDGNNAQKAPPAQPKPAPRPATNNDGVTSAQSAFLKTFSMALLQCESEAEMTVLMENSAPEREKIGVVKGTKAGADLAVMWRARLDQIRDADDGAFPGSEAA